MTNSETKNFSQNVSSSYYLRGKCSDECKKDSLNVPKLRFKGYNDEWKQNKLGNIAKYKTKKIKVLKKYFISTENMKTNNEGIDNYCDNEYTVGTSFIEDDILIANIRPYLRKFWFATNKGACSSDVLVLSPQQIYPLFLKYIISNDSFFSYVMIGSKGTKMPRGDKNHILEYKIWLPSLPEQEKIAAFLTLIDKKIEKQKELVELLKKYKRGLLSQIFSQKLRFKDENGNNYPDWEEKRLGDICTTFSGGTPSVTHQEYYNGEIPFIKSGEIHSDKTEMFITDIGLKNSSAKLVKKGDLLFALYGATSAEVDISKINGAINQAILCVQSDTLNLNYLKELLSYNKNKILCKYLQGGQGNLSADIFKSLKFKFPIKKEQDKISDFLINYDKITHIEEHLLNLYINYKQGLLQQLFI